MSVTPASRPLGYTQVTSLSSAAGVGTIPTGTAYALIQAESQPVRWRDDGTNPSATVGMRLLVGGELYADVQNLAVLKFIEEAASAKLNIAFYAIGQ